MTGAIQRILRSQFLWVLVAWSLFAALCVTLHHRGLSYFDANDFAGPIAGRGLPHPPSYPLLVLLCKIINLFAGDPLQALFYLNLASSLAAIICIYFLLTWESSTSVTRNAALCACLLLLSGFYFKLWTILPEKFLLNLALFSLLGLLVTAWYSRPTPTRFGLIGLAYGLGASHHHTLAFTLPSLLILMWCKRREINWRRSIALCFPGFLLGLTPLLYLFWTSNPEPDYSYYYVNSLESFLFVFLRKGYGTFQLLTGESAPPWRVCLVMLNGMFKNLNYFCVIFLAPLVVAIGLSTNFRKRMVTSAPMLYASLTSLIFFYVFSRNSGLKDLDNVYNVNMLLRYVTVPSTLLTIPIAFGLQWLFNRSRGHIWFGITVLTVLLSNSLFIRELDFHNDSLIDYHLMNGFKTIHASMSQSPENTTSSLYLPCIIFAFEDEFNFGARYLNEFRFGKRCYVFSPTTAVIGQMRAKFEQELLFGNDWDSLRNIFLSEGRDRMFGAFFERLILKGYRVFLLDMNSMNWVKTGLRAMPFGNILELRQPDQPPPDLEQVDLEYLRTTKTFLETLVEHPPSQAHLAPAVQLAPFFNLLLYPRFIKPTDEMMDLLDTDLRLYERVFGKPLQASAPF